MKSKTVRAMTESAIMIAMATVLSLLTIIKLPYGGSVTPACMLPIAIIAYRHGLGWGLSSGLVFGVIQQLVNLGTLSYVTTWQSVLAVILLDYVVAFALIGVAGSFRHKVASRSLSLTLGVLLSSLLRYTCHVISGATVWAGLSIPTEAALGFSLVYNATYMLPEAIVLMTAAFYVGANIDLLAEKPLRARREARPSAVSFASPLAGLLVCGAVIYDTVAIFSQLQDGETGEFNITQIVNVNYLAVTIVTGTALLLALGLLLFKFYKTKKHESK